MADSWKWLAEQFEAPDKRFARVGADRPQPEHKPAPPVKILPNVTGLRTDEQVSEFLERHRDSQVVLNYGSSWCTHCHELFPCFVGLTRQFGGLAYGVAQVDYMREAVRGISYTPTFAVFRRGKKVDQFYGSDKQTLRDRIWLHADG